MKTNTINPALAARISSAASAVTGAPVEAPAPSPEATTAEQLTVLVQKLGDVRKTYSATKRDAKPYATDEVAETATATYASVQGFVTKARAHQLKGDLARARRFYLSAINAADCAAMEWRACIPTTEQQEAEAQAEAGDLVAESAPEVEAEVEAPTSGFSYSDAPSEHTSFEHAIVYRFGSGEVREIYRTKYLSYAQNHARACAEATNRADLEVLVGSYICSTAEFRGVGAYSQGQTLAARIAADVFPELPQPEQPNPSDEERVAAALRPEPRHIDAIAWDAGMDTTRAAALLLILELKRVARRLPGRMFELLPSPVPPSEDEA